VFLQSRKPWISVDLRSSLYISMAQDFLQLAKISVVANEVVGEGVSQQMAVQLQEIGSCLESVHR
jgi:hypothetical protein